MMVRKMYFLSTIPILGIYIEFQRIITSNYLSIPWYKVLVFFASKILNHNEEPSWLTIEMSIVTVVAYCVLDAASNNKVPLHRASSNQWIYIGTIYIPYASASAHLPRVWTTIELNRLVLFLLAAATLQHHSETAMPSVDGEDASTSSGDGNWILQVDMWSAS